MESDLDILMMTTLLSKRPSTIIGWCEGTKLQINLFYTKGFKNILIIAISYTSGLMDLTDNYRYFSPHNIVLD